jgi:hypothetical protein
MPIIEPHASGEPLNQGDLLRGVKLFLTGKTDALTGGESVVSKTDHCLVLSRPCVTAHKGAVVVAAVQRMPSQTPVEIKTLDRALNFLTQLRDGNDSPDVFYLGQLPGKESDGRYAARLDSIHTIEIPQKPDLRTAFIEKHRFAKLHIDFQRDLHTRVFQAFATLGFEDITWFSDADLNYLVEVGKAEIGVLQSEKVRLEASSQADGGNGNDTKSVVNKAEVLEKKIKPFQTELDKRKNQPSQG